MSLLANRVKETSTTTGTVTLNLDGAVSGYKTFVAGIGTTNKCQYTIRHRTAAEWEMGIGTVTDAAPDTLARTTVISSSNSDAAVNFSAGTKEVFVSPLASYITPIYYGDSAPTGPVSNDLWYETDTNILWRYNGTYWMTNQLFYMHNPKPTAISGATAQVELPARHDNSVDYDFYLVDLLATTYVATTNGASDYWRINAVRWNPTDGWDNVGTGISTNSDSADTYYQHEQSLNEYIDVSNIANGVYLIGARSAIIAGSPGNLTPYTRVTYRLVHL